MTDSGGSGAGSTVEWTTLDDLPQGALFETENGVLAVKSEYRYRNDQWECVLLSSGEYAHYAKGNAQVVRQVDIGQLRADLEQVRGLLARLSQWDHFDSAGDGPYWREEIAKVLQ